MKVELKSPLLQANDQLAEKNRTIFRDLGITVVNILSSPGAGKTTLLEKGIPQLSRHCSIGVIEGDIFTTKDAERVAAYGVPVVQINTRGACHLDARMVDAVLERLPLEQLDLLFIENVGNLVCPAEFDLGENFKLAVLSVAEGSDKVPKYPVAFARSRAAVINKIDLLQGSDFDMEQATSDLIKINPHLVVHRVSARTGEGLEGLWNWLLQQMSC